MFRINFVHYLFPNHPSSLSLSMVLIFFQFDLIDQTQGEFQMLLSQLLFYIDNDLLLIIQTM